MSTQQFAFLLHVLSVSNPGTVFQSRDFGIGKRHSRDRIPTCAVYADSVNIFFIND